jgi:hypothetical protein
VLEQTRQRYRFVVVGYIVMPGQRPYAVGIGEYAPSANCAKSGAPTFLLCRAIKTPGQTAQPLH